MVDLSGIQGKLDRADEHLKSVDTELAVFRKQHPYDVMIEPNHDRTEYVARVDGVVPVPLPISVLVGDCLYNMRSALDHLVYQLVIDNGRTAGFKTAFPIFTDPSLFRETTKTGKPTSRSGMKKIEGCSSAAQAIIEGLQPYARLAGKVNASGPIMERLLLQNPLKVLDDLTNIDKHRLLHIAWTSVIHEAVWVQDLDNFPDGGGPTRFGPVENGAVVARYVFPRPVDPTEVSFQISIEETLEHEWQIQTGAVYGAVERLHKLRAGVDETVGALT